MKTDKVGAESGAQPDLISHAETASILARCGIHEQPEPPEQLVIDIARELYDRFVMGGWQPQDAYLQIRAMLARGVAKHSESGAQPGPSCTVCGKPMTPVLSASGRQTGWGCVDCPGPPTERGAEPRRPIEHDALREAFEHECEAGIARGDLAWMYVAKTFNFTLPAREVAKHAPRPPVSDTPSLRQLLLDKFELLDQEYGPAWRDVVWNLFQPEHAGTEGRERGGVR
jgi:hypothetical protein